MSGTSLNIEVDDILEEEKLPEYVDDSLIAYLKRRGPSDIYYFIQFGSSTMAFKDCRVVVKDVLTMTDGVFVVPVMFKKENFESAVIAYVKKQTLALKSHLYQIFAPTE